MTSWPLDELQAAPTRPGMRARDLVGSGQGFRSLFVSELELATGAAIPLHTHPQEEAFVVMAGRLVFRLGDEEIEVAAGATVRIPAGVAHAVRNDRPELARSLAAAAADRATWFTERTTYLSGVPRE
ncbi:MAG: cupin domain-containing protein [Dehalococcoidia bacterium]